jgi:hypothetical protein
MEGPYDALMREQAFVDERFNTNETDQKLTKVKMASRYQDIRQFCILL